MVVKSASFVWYDEEREEISREGSVCILVQVRKRDFMMCTCRECRKEGEDSMNMKEKPEGFYVLMLCRIFREKNHKKLQSHLIGHYNFDGSCCSK